MNAPIHQELTAAWARRQLDLTEEATPVQARGAFLRRLSRDGFVPPPNLDYAQRVLAQSPDITPAHFGWQQAQADLETDLRRQVDEFAQAYLDLSAADQVQRHRGLQEQCAGFPHLQARLEILQPGLCPPLGDLQGPQQQLAVTLRELFTQSPEKRALQRRELRTELIQNNDTWVSAAWQLQKHDPRFTRLDVTLWNDITQQKAREHEARNAAKSRAKTHSSGGGNAGLASLGWVGALVIAAILRFAFSSSSTPAPRPAPFQPPQFFQPAPQFDFDKVTRDLEKQRQEMFRELGKISRDTMKFGDNPFLPKKKAVKGDPFIRNPIPDINSPSPGPPKP